jgi:hypothetical protein
MLPGSQLASNATLLLGTAYNQSMAVPPNSLYQPMYSQQVYSPGVSPMPGSGLFGEDVSMFMNMGVQLAPMLLGINGMAGDPLGPTMALSDRLMRDSRRLETAAIARAMIPGDIDRTTPLFTGLVRMRDPKADPAEIAKKGREMAAWANEAASDPNSPLRMIIGQAAAMGAIPADALSGYTVLGELALDGTISSVTGVLPAAIAANMQGHGLICPARCGPEAAWASSELEVLAPQTLVQLANHMRGVQLMARPVASAACAMRRTA